MVQNNALNSVASTLVLLFVISPTLAIVDADAQPWIYKLPKSHRKPVCRAPLYMGVVKHTPISQMNERENEDFQKYLFSSVELKSDDVRFVFANISNLLYFNQSDDWVFGYPSSRHRPMKNLADLLYAMREYVYPRKIYPQISKVLVVMTDVIAQNISGVLEESEKLRKSGVYIVLVGVRNSVGDTRLLRQITNNKRNVHVYHTVRDLVKDFRDVLFDICSSASSLTRVRGLQVHPNFGPESGGTRLTVVGHTLSKNPVHRIALGPLPCKIDRDRSEYVTVECITRTSKGTSVRLNQALTMTVYFTNRKTMEVKNAFKYKADPIIRAVNPRRTILSGGILLTVSGRNMDSVAKPILLIYMEFQRRLREIFTSEGCKIVGVFNITCPTPKLDLPNEVTFEWMTTTTAAEVQTEPPKSAITNPNLRFYLGLRLDGIMRYRNLSRNLPAYSDIDVFIDPKIEHFEQSPIVLKPGVPYLDIKGSKLTLGLTIRDYVVKVGDSICEVIYVNYNRITFKPPRRPPKGLKDFDGSHRVEVLIGVGYLSFTPGNVSYANYVMTYIGIGCTLVLLLILIAIIVVWYFKKYKKKPEENLDSKPPIVKDNGTEQKSNKKEKKDNFKDNSKDKLSKSKQDESKLDKAKGKSKFEEAKEKFLPSKQEGPPLPKRNAPLPKITITVNDGSGPIKGGLYKIIPPRTK